MKWMLFIGILLASGVASAQTTDGSGSGSGSGDGSGGTGASPTGDATAGSWGQLNDRPLVIPQNKIDLHGAIPILTFSTPDGMGGTTNTTGEGLALGGAYGATDKIEVGADLLFRLHPNGGVTTGVFGVHGAYAAMKTDKLELAVAGAIDVNFTSTTNEFQLQLGAWARYQVAPKVSLFTGQPAIPFTLGGLATFLAPPIGYQLSIGLNNSQPISISLPAGIGFQGTPQLFVFAALDLADIYLANGPISNAATGDRKSANLIFADFIPVGLGGFYSVNDKLDLGVEFGDDFKHAGDIYVITLVGRYYVK